MACCIGATWKAGGVQIVARVLETGLHKMETIGFDVTRVVSAMGTAPLPTTARSDMRAIGRTNDCILYGGQARYTVRAEDEELAQLYAPGRHARVIDFVVHQIASLLAGGAMPS